MKLRVTQKSLVPRAVQHDGPGLTLIGKAVTFRQGDNVCVGVVKRADSAGSLGVALAFPGEAGILFASDTIKFLKLEEVSVMGEAVFHDTKVRGFDDSFQATTKALEIKSTDGRIEDYQDVKVFGLASTFAERTPSDRDGDYVLPSAFTKTIKNFLANPVMLVDHVNSVRNMVGSYTKVANGKEGLMVEGSITNAPEERKVRFLAMEGHLKAFSIGGLFYYGADGKAIEQVSLYEISLVAVPANPDALFRVRGVDLSDSCKAWSGKSLSSWML